MDLCGENPFRHRSSHHTIVKQTITKRKTKAIAINKRKNISIIIKTIQLDSFLILFEFNIIKK